MRRLTLKIHETLPGRTPPVVADHETEAARRYRALVLTTLRQLRGLERVRLSIATEPEDAAEAIRFWLLPRLADRWQSRGSVFLAEGWEIDFGEENASYQVEASGDVRCPFLGARWVHTAMLGLERGEHEVIGPAKDGGEYFRARPVPAAASLAERMLPELPVVREDTHWHEALASPLGPALKRAWEEEG